MWLNRFRIWWARPRSLGWNRFIVDAESHQEAAKAFEGHPHLQIPQSSIQISELNQMGM